MQVVVTGATGHLGRWVVHALAQAGHEVVAVSRSGERPAPPFGEMPAPAEAVRAVALDIAVESSVQTLADHLGPAAALVHLAAWHPPSTASTTAEDRRRLLEVNVLGTMRALDAARCTHGGAACVVYASTFEVYGDPQTPLITEDHPTRPLTDYGATKLAGEDHLLVFEQEEHCRTVALRMPAIYGPGEETPRALPLLLAAAARGERPAIYGDGLDLRDQLYVSDAAAAVVRAVTSSARGIFNVTDGEPHSIAEIARCAMQVTGFDGEPRFLPRSKSRRDYHMSIERSRQELSFSPQVALRQGMEKQLQWLRASSPTGLTVDHKYPR